MDSCHAHQSTLPLYLNENCIHKKRNQQRMEKDTVGELLFPPKRYSGL